MKLFGLGKRNLQRTDIQGKAVQNQTAQDDPFYCDYGIRMVCPSDIVELSLPFKEIMNDTKMKWLREQVAKKEWNDPSPYTLHLELMPTGKYVVASGGNHRSVLARELGLEEIKASISVKIPSELVPERTKTLVRHLTALQSITEEYYLNKCRYIQAHIMDMRGELISQVDKEFSDLDKILNSYNERRSIATSSGR